MTNSRHKKNANSVFKKWCAELMNKDRSAKHVQNNFEELFEEMWRYSITYDIAEEFLDDAVKEHFPSDFVAKNSFKAIKPHLDRTGKSQTFHEWLKGWKDSIASKARIAFHIHYPIPEEAPVKEKKKYGQMSAEEYNKQQRVANSFVEIDVEALKKKLNN